MMTFLDFVLLWLMLLVIARRNDCSWPVQILAFSVGMIWFWFHFWQGWSQA